jgi:hypothetical protein
LTSPNSPSSKEMDGKPFRSVPWGASATWFASITAVYWAASVPLQTIPDGIAHGGTQWTSYSVTSALIITLPVFVVCFVLSFLWQWLTGNRKMRSVLILALSMTSVFVLLTGALEWYGALHHR